MQRDGLRLLTETRFSALAAVLTRDDANRRGPRKGIQTYDVTGRICAIETWITLIKPKAGE